MKEIKKFVDERNAALFSLDRARIEAFFEKYNFEKPVNDTVFWALVYKCICGISSAPPDIAMKAKAWLLEHGMTPEIS